MGGIEIRRRADFVLLDRGHPDLAVGTDNHWLDAWVFVAGRAAVHDVLVGGERIVAEGRHRDRDALTGRYVATVERLLAA